MVTRFRESVADPNTGEVIQYFDRVVDLQDWSNSMRTQGFKVDSSRGLLQGWKYMGIAKKPISIKSETIVKKIVNEPAPGGNKNFYEEYFS